MHYPLSHIKELCEQSNEYFMEFEFKRTIIEDLMMRARGVKLWNYSKNFTKNLNKFTCVKSLRQRSFRELTSKVHMPIIFYGKVCTVHLFFFKLGFNFTRFSSHLWQKNKFKADGYMMVEMHRNKNPPSYNRRERFKMHIL